MGFELFESGERHCDIIWANNCILLAGSITEADNMIEVLTTALREQLGWSWKPSSCEMVGINVDLPGESHSVALRGGGTAKYEVRQKVVSLGVCFDPAQLSRGLVEHRLGKGDAAVHKYFKVLSTPAPVGEKLAAWAGAPRATARFCLAIAFWNMTLLRSVLRWERRHLRRIFRMKRQRETEST